jgi:hypothetical protein
MSCLHLRALVLPLLCAAASACSGGSNKNDTPPAADAGPQADASTAQPDGNTAPIACTPVTDFTDLGVINGDVLVNAENGYLSIDGVVEAGPPVDLFVIDLFAGYGVFTDGLKTGTFTITGDETDYNTCGVCVSVLGDFDPMTGSPMMYVAQSGTVTITSIEGNFTGSFVPDAGSASFVGATFNETSEMFEDRNDCTIMGGGATWDKAIPAATP